MHALFRARSIASKHAVSFRTALPAAAFHSHFCDTVQFNSDYEQWFACFFIRLFLLQFFRIIAAHSLYFYQLTLPLHASAQHCTSPAPCPALSLSLWIPRHWPISQRAIPVSITGVSWSSILLAPVNSTRSIQKFEKNENIFQDCFPAEIWTYNSFRASRNSVLKFRKKLFSRIRRESACFFEGPLGKRTKIGPNISENFLRAKEVLLQNILNFWLHSSKTDPFAHHGVKSTTDVMSFWVTLHMQLCFPLCSWVQHMKCTFFEKVHFLPKFAE